MEGIVLDQHNGGTGFRYQKSGEFIKNNHSDKSNIQKHSHDCCSRGKMAPSNQTSLCIKADIVDGKMGVKDSTPRHPQYQNYSSRLESFVAWPGRYVPKTPEELATAGFFYIGSADRVTCFQCGITLRDWEEEHDPVTEHKRYAPNCDFIAQTHVGNLHAAEITGEDNTTSTSSCTGASATSKSRTSLVTESDINEHKSIETRMEPITVSSNTACDSLSEGSNRDLHLGGGACADPLNVKGQPVTDISHQVNVTDDIKQQDTKTHRGHSFSDSDDTVKDCVQPIITNSVPKSTKSNKLTSLLKENRRLKEQVICRICKNQGATILFLPCGHLVTCPDCADTVHDCVLCGKTILGTVKTFRA